MPALASAWKALSSDLLIPSDVRDFYSLPFLYLFGLLLLLQGHTFPSWCTPQFFLTSLCSPVNWYQPHPLASEPCFVTSQVLTVRILIWGKSFDLA